MSQPEACARGRLRMSYTVRAAQQGTPPKCVWHLVYNAKSAMQADKDFIDILARMRSGASTTKDLQELEASCNRPLDLSDGILPTMVRLCTFSLIVASWLSLVGYRSRTCQGVEHHRLVPHAPSARLFVAVGYKQNLCPLVVCGEQRPASVPLVKVEDQGLPSECFVQANYYTRTLALRHWVRACVQLYTHCEDVERVNAQRLAELPGDSVRFAAQDTGRTEALQACQVSCSPCLTRPALVTCLAMRCKQCTLQQMHTPAGMPWAARVRADALVPAIRLSGPRAPHCVSLMSDVKTAAPHPKVAGRRAGRAWS